jgi:hypothetical protein
MPSSHRGSLPLDLQAYRIKVLIFLHVCYKYSLFRWIRNSVGQQPLALSLSSRLIIMHLITGHYHVLLNPSRLTVTDIQAPLGTRTFR